MKKREQSEQALYRKWVNALRSGDYEQGGRVLLQNGAHCCLGVFCDVYKNETGRGKWIDAGKHKGMKAFLIDGQKNYAYLPKKFEHFFPRATENQALLSNMNDFRQASFEEIADFIEKNLIHDDTT